MIVHLLLGNPQKMTGEALAKKFGVSGAQISSDLNSDEYAELCAPIINRYLNGNLAPMAVKNIAKEVMRENEDPKRGVNTSKWLLRLLVAGGMLNVGGKDSDMDRFKKALEILAGKHPVDSES